LGPLKRANLNHWPHDLFLSSGEERETPTLLGPLERANLNHWPHELFLSSGEEKETPTLLGPFKRANLNHWPHDLFLSSGEERETPTLLGPLKRANLTHRTRCRFRNVFIYMLNSGRWTKSRNPVILSVTQHHQSPLDYALICIINIWRISFFFSILISKIPGGGRRLGSPSCPLPYTYIAYISIDGNDLSIGNDNGASSQSVPAEELQTADTRSQASRFLKHCVNGGPSLEKNYSYLHLHDSSD
jgi:hypothetical protein